MDPTQLKETLDQIAAEADTLPPEANEARLELRAALDQAPPDVMRVARALRELADALMAADRADLAKKLNRLPGE